jgi:hypothetical protein
VLDDAVRLHLGDDVGEQRRIGGGRCRRGSAAAARCRQGRREGWPEGWQCRLSPAASGRRMWPCVLPCVLHRAVFPRSRNAAPARRLMSWLAVLACVCSLFVLSCDPALRKRKVKQRAPACRHSPADHPPHGSQGEPHAIRDRPK